MIHAAESGHWYYPDGKPAYQVPGSRHGGEGKLVTPDVRHARKLGLLPGVTTIIRQAAAPGLERWKQEQVLHAALTLPRLPDEPEAAYIYRIWADSKEQGKKAAERGTAIHKAIQGHYEGIPPDEDYLRHVQGVDTAVDVWTKGSEPFDWIAEASFAHPSGFGGKTDLSGGEFLCDFKTKEFAHDAKLDTYDEHAMQLAAYREGLQMSTARCAIVYVSVTVPGLAKVIELEESKLKQGWEMFKSLLLYYRAKNKL